MAGMLEKALAFRERVGTWCGTLASIGVGIVLWVGPTDIKEQILYHREIGAGFVIFGIIMFFALILRGQAGYRMRSLALAFLSFVIGGLLCWWIQGTALDVLALKETGEYRQVAVLGRRMKYNPQNRKSTILTEVKIDDKIVTVKLSQASRRGQMVTVLTAPSRRSAIVDGNVEQSWLALIDVVIGRWIALGVVITALFCAISLPRMLWRFIAGSPPGEDPDRDRP